MPYARKDIITWQVGSYYHIYNRGTSRATIFREKINYLFAMEKIHAYSRSKHIAAVIAYCLMPNHYHFLLRQDGKEPAGDLPRFVFNSYTKAYNRMYSHSGTLFESRFRAKMVQSKSHLLHLCRYIHGNPVKDGMTADPGDWPYSNYLEWIGERDGSLVDREFIDNQFSNGGEYKKFLFEYLNSRKLPHDVQGYLNDMER